MPEANASKKRTAKKSNLQRLKPHPDFALYAHASGRWAKVIRQRVHYFGRWGHKAGGEVVPVADVEASAYAALAEFERQWPYLSVGRTPPPDSEADGALTVAKLADHFLNAKRHLLDTGEITLRTFKDAYRVAEIVVNAFGAERRVDDLRQSDFATFRAQLAETRGPVALGNEINRIRGVFKHAFDAGLIAAPVRFGPGFARPSRKTLRIHRQRKQQAHGKRMFEAHELRQILEAAKQPLEAMVLLAANAGLGQTDIANLPQSALDLQTGWLDYARPKTGVERRAPLWPETIASLRETLAARPMPKDTIDTDLVFLTRRGTPWIKVTEHSNDDAIAKEFNKILHRLGLKRPGRSFYAIRHGFQTVAGEAKDPEAVSSIMGHVDASMAGLYRESISDARLKAVVSVVHHWLFTEI